MTFDIYDNLITKLNEAPDLFAGGTPAFRGEMGKTTIPKAPSCILLPDIATPMNLDEIDDDSGKDKKLFFVANLFVLSTRKKTQSEAEDAALQLALDIIDRVQGVEQTVTVGGRTESNFWELSNVEFVERSASGCVIALEFRMPVYL